ncbi:MAG: PhoD-like phosphatase N-terminal domain-containing protein, partial [Bradymonadaceae bacterium]
MTDDLPSEFDALDDRRSTTLDRREFLAFVGASLATSACGGAFDAATPAGDDGSSDGPLAKGDNPNGEDSMIEEIPANPFQLGVASGDPTPEGAILWTRLVPDPLGEATMPA